MKRTSGGHGTRRSGGHEREQAPAGPPAAGGLRGRHGAERPPGLDPRVRLAALVVALAAAVLLPLAVAAAGPVGGDRVDDGDRERDAKEPAAPHRDAKEPAAPSSRSPHLLGLGLATAARCGPTLTSPEGVEAQSCVFTQGAETWARAYYRNTTGRALSTALSLLKPGGGAVRIDCAIGAEDEPGTCETPRQRTDGEPGGYEAVAEFARGAAGAAGAAADAKDGAGADEGPLLLRVGSGSARS
ncbi:hypothetical protein [Streptomyces sp. C1-2]|uniref:hypothetical protein n=1 Tax=Streptomyces sp. C1-2 TaxID=2720022 RepID=UPI001F101419|nr:hypothetical protein [Streptomyces sp. C1-2]